MSRSKGKRREKRPTSGRGERRASGSVSQDASRETPRDVLRIILLIALIALAVRVAYIVEVHEHPLMMTTTGDPQGVASLRSSNP